MTADRPSGEASVISRAPFSVIDAVILMDLIPRDSEKSKFN